MTLGFCPDYKADLNVGEAMDGLLVGSQDVAHDRDKLNELGVTHILNVAYGVANVFPDVSLSELITLITKHNYFRESIFFLTNMPLDSYSYANTPACLHDMLYPTHHLFHVLFDPPLPNCLGVSVTLVMNCILIDCLVYLN